MSSEMFRRQQAAIAAVKALLNKSAIEGSTARYPCDDVNTWKGDEDCLTCRKLKFCSGEEQ